MDEYKLRLYKAAAQASECGIPCLEALPLCGFKSGNHEQLGCLTDDESVRIHSCGRDKRCSILRQRKVVWITPVLSCTESGIICEKGAGGGGGDLVRKHSDAKTAYEWIKLCAERIVDTDTRSKSINLIERVLEPKDRALSPGERGVPSSRNLEEVLIATLDKIANSAFDFPKPPVGDYTSTGNNEQTGLEHLDGSAPTEIVSDSTF